MYGDARPTSAITSGRDGSPAHFTSSGAHKADEDIEDNVILYSRFLDRLPTDENTQKTGVELPMARYLRYLREENLPLRIDQLDWRN